MTDGERAGWYGIAGLVGLAGLGALFEGGRRVRNPISNAEHAALIAERNAARAEADALDEGERGGARYHAAWARLAAAEAAIAAARPAPYRFRGKVPQAKW